MPAPPPGQFGVRTDAGARKLVERMDGVRKDVDELREDVHSVGVGVARLEGQVQQAVTWPKLVAILGGFATVVLSTVGAFFYFSVARLDTSAAAGDAKRAAEMATLRADFEKRNEEWKLQKATLEAVLRVTVDGKSRQQARREWESKTGVPRIDVNP